MDLKNFNFQLVQDLRSEFFKKFELEQPDFCPEDVDRVRNDDLWLIRWLEMKHCVVNDSLIRLWEGLEWRKKFGTNGNRGTVKNLFSDIKESDFPAHFFERGTFLIRNEDRDGKKLLICFVRNHTRESDELEMYKKGIIYFAEILEFENHSEQITLIFDLTGTTFKNVDLKLMHFAATCLKQYYPTALSYLIIYNLPWFLVGMFQIVKKWIPKRFVSRLKVVDRDTIGLYISKKNRLVQWGGDDDYVYKFIPQENPMPVRKGKRKDINSNIVKS